MESDLQAEKDRELKAFVRFVKRLEQEGLLDIVGIMNIDPKTNEIDVLRLATKKRK